PVSEFAKPQLSSKQVPLWPAASDSVHRPTGRSRGPPGGLRLCRRRSFSWPAAKTSASHLVGPPRSNHHWQARADRLLSRAVPGRLGTPTRDLPRRVRECQLESGERRPLRNLTAPSREVRVSSASYELPWIRQDALGPDTDSNCTACLRLNDRLAGAGKATTRHSS